MEPVRDEGAWSDPRGDLRGTGGADPDDAAGVVRPPLPFFGRPLFFFVAPSKADPALPSAAAAFDTLDVLPPSVPFMPEIIQGDEAHARDRPLQHPRTNDPARAPPPAAAAAGYGHGARVLADGRCKMKESPGVFWKK